MKRNAMVFGLIAGAIVSIFMLVGMAICNGDPNYNISMIIGYAAMILAFSFVFVGVKNFRDKYNNGVLSFGKALQLGLLIALIASSMYVITWVIDYHLFIPDFMDKYAEHMVNNIKASGVSQVEIDKKIAEMAGYKEMYKNPLYVVLFTYFEILPIGILAALLSALILKRKPKDPIIAI